MRAPPALLVASEGLSHEGVVLTLGEGVQLPLLQRDQAQVFHIPRGRGRTTVDTR
jgi:hypothetical protein